MVARTRGKKKGKKLCKECSWLGRDCVKASCAGFRLSGIPDDHHHSSINGVFKRTDSKENARHVYQTNDELVSVFHCEDAWRIRFGKLTDKDAEHEKRRIRSMSPELFANMPDSLLDRILHDLLKQYSCALTPSLAASPAGIRKDSPWETILMRGTEVVTEEMRGIIKITVLDEKELMVAIANETHFLLAAVGQAAPAFLLSGFPAGHHHADMAGLYQRQDDQEKVNGRFVYKAANGPWWAWPRNNRSWNFGIEADIHTDRVAFQAPACVAAPEMITTKGWVLSPDRTTVPLTTTAVHHKPAQTFTGTCAECDHCGEWRRCGQSSTGRWYCRACCANSKAGANPHEVYVYGVTTSLIETDPWSLGGCTLA